MGGCKGNEMRETFHGDRIAVADIRRDRIVQGQ
jgi:hypothetical protein